MSMTDVLLSFVQNSVRDQ